MSNGSWEQIYVDQGSVQIEVLDSVIEASDLFSSNNYKKILDLGCGTGRHTYYLADKGFEVYACDISERGLDITKELLDEGGFDNVDYSIQDMYNLTYKDDIFDGILCIWVQGHGTKEEVQRGINELHRVLKNNGTVVTDFVTVDDITFGIGEKIAPRTFVGGRPGEEGIPHYYTTRDELKAMFKDFRQVNLKDKVYRFTDVDGNEHEIVAVIVEAKK